MRFNRDVGWSTLVAAASALLMFVAAQGAVAAGIAGSKHDFTNSVTGSGAYGKSGETQICVYCHAPHNSKNTAQLWNRDPSTTTTFTLYTNAFGTLNATTAQPGDVSKLCLSCHDGTIAVDSYGTNTGTKKITAGGALIGADLSNDHPIGFSYNAALVAADGNTNLKDPTTLTTVKLYNTDKLECATCHDVHNTAGNSGLLRVANTGSALCTTCHIK